MVRRIVVCVLLIALLPSCRSQSLHATSPPVASSRLLINRDLVAAVKANDLARTEALLAQGADPNARDDSGMAHWRVVSAQRQEDTTLHPYQGPTVLMIACRESRADIADRLLKAGADPNALGVDYGAAQDVTEDGVDLESHVTPLVEAVFAGNPSMLRLLLHHGAHINAQCRKGMSDGLTALDEADNMIPTSMGEMSDEQMKRLSAVIDILTKAGGKK